MEVPYSKKNMQFDGYVVIFTGDAASVVQVTNCTFIEPAKQLTATTVKWSILRLRIPLQCVSQILSVRLPKKYAYLAGLSPWFFMTI